jgi:hypothetical protein
MESSFTFLRAVRAAGKLESGFGLVGLQPAEETPDVRVQQPSAKQALSNETGFLQYASRTDVLDIAHRTDAKH